MVFTMVALDSGPHVVCSFRSVSIPYRVLYYGDMTAITLPAAYCTECAATGKQTAISAHAAYYRGVHRCGACAARQRHRQRPPSTRFDGEGGHDRAVAAAREKTRRDRAAHKLVADLRDRLAALQGQS